jgi:hypothetical protein
VSKFDEIVVALREVRDAIVGTHTAEAHRLDRIAWWLDRRITEARQAARKDTEGAVHRAAKATEASAALMAMPKTGTQRALAYEGIVEAWATGRNGLTFEEIAALPDVADNAHRTRVRELVLGGHVRDSGLTRPNERGNDEIVWTPTLGSPN